RDGPVARPPATRPAALDPLRPRPGSAPARRSGGDRYRRRRYAGHRRDAADRRHPLGRGRPRRNLTGHRLRVAGPAHPGGGGEPRRRLRTGGLPSAADAIGGGAGEVDPGRPARRGDERGVQRPPAPPGRGPSPARPGGGRRRRGGVRPAGRAGASGLQPVAVGCRAGPATPRLAAGLGRRRPGAAAGPVHRGPGVPGPAARRGDRRRAAGGGGPPGPAGVPGMNLPPVPRVETCVTVSTATARDLTRPRRDHAGADRAAALRRRAGGYARTLARLGILASLAWKVGTGGFLAALRVIDAGTLLAAGGIGLFTTVLNAWRWCLVARGLGIAL